MSLAQAASELVSGSRGHGEVTQTTPALRGVASKTVSKGKGAQAWAKQLRRELRFVELAMRELAQGVGRAQFRPALLVIANRTGGAVYLRWRAPDGFVTGVALVQRMAREPEPVRQWYAQADAQAQLLNARAAAARFALRLAEQIEQAEPA